MTLLSVHVMVRDGAAVVGRAIRSLGRLPEAEVVLVDCGSTDATVRVVEEASHDVGLAFRSVAVPPELFFPDEPGSFGHRFVDDYTGLPVLSDWAAARNLGLDLCKGRYVLKLDADDVCVEPEKVVPAVEYLESRGDAGLLACPYEVVDGGEVDYRVLYTRVWRNLPQVRFREVCHENVDWARHEFGRVGARDGALFRDMRDSPERARRPRNAYFKALLREYERLCRELCPPGQHLRLYLAEEALRPLVSLVPELLVGVGSMVQQDQAWACWTLGRAYDRLGNRELASEYYDDAAVLGCARAELYRAVLLGTRTTAGNARLCRAEDVNRTSWRCYPEVATERELRRAREPGRWSLAFDPEEAR